MTASSGDTSPRFFGTGTWTGGECAACGDDGLPFLREQEVNELLRSLAVGRALDDGHRARDDEHFLRESQSHVGALLDLVDGDVIGGECGHEVARCRVVHDLARALSDDGAVGGELPQVIPTEVIGDHGDTDQRGARESRVGDSHAFLEPEVEQVVPGGRHFLHLLGVVGDPQGAEAGGGEIAIGVLYGALDVLRLGGDVFFEHAFLFELVEVGNFAVPENIHRHLSRLALGGHLGHEFSRSRRIVVEGYVGVLFHEGVAQLPDQAFLHGGVDHQLLGGAGILACTEGQADGGGQKQECSFHVLPLLCEVQWFVTRAL